MKYTKLQKEKIISYFKKYGSKKTTKKFGVSVASIYNWIKDDRKTSSKIKINENAFLKKNWDEISTEDLKETISLLLIIKKEILGNV